MTLEKACRQLIIEQPFFGLFLMQLYKEITTQIDTLAVAPHGIGVKLMINMEFWNSLSDKEQIAVLIHELSHICFGHIFMSKEFENHELFNMAADLEVNSYINNLPNGCLLPSIYHLPEGKGTKFYYENLNKVAKIINCTSVDDHSTWKEFKSISDAEKELIKQQVDYQLKNTVNQLKNCGNIPGQFKEKIDALFKIKKQIFNWKSYFRNMLSAVFDTKIKKSHRRESLRFAGGADIKYRRKQKILVAIDTSGSISQSELCDFFSEIHHIYKAGAEIRIIECDTEINRNYEYNGKWDMTCSGRGGTILRPCSDYYMSHRKEYSKLVVFTDGYFNLDDIQSPQSDNIFIITSTGQQQKYPGKTIYIPKNEDNNA